MTRFMCIHCGEWYDSDPKPVSCDLCIRRSQMTCQCDHCRAHFKGRIPKRKRRDPKTGRLMSRYLFKKFVEANRRLFIRPVFLYSVSHWPWCPAVEENILKNTPEGVIRGREINEACPDGCYLPR